MYLIVEIFSLMFFSNKLVRDKTLPYFSLRMYFFKLILVFPENLEENLKANKNNYK